MHNFRQRLLGADAISGPAMRLETMKLDALMLQSLWKHGSTAYYYLPTLPT
jgi:hypothetical protein